MELEAQQRRYEEERRADELRRAEEIRREVEQRRADDESGSPCTLPNGERGTWFIQGYGGKRDCVPYGQGSPKTQAGERPSSTITGE